MSTRAFSAASQASVQQASDYSYSFLKAPALNLESMIASVIASLSGVNLTPLLAFCHTSPVHTSDCATKPFFGALLAMPPIPRGQPGWERG